MRVLFGGGERELRVARPDAALAVGTLQRYLDDFLARNPRGDIDYIHGEEALRALCAREETVGFLLPGLPKGDLLPAVRRDGALPRKTFSMGEAQEKRYYLECRRIK